MSNASISIKNAYSCCRPIKPLKIPKGRLLRWLLLTSLYVYEHSVKRKQKRHLQLLQIIQAVKDSCRKLGELVMAHISSDMLERWTRTDANRYCRWLSPLKMPAGKLLSKLNPTLLKISVCNQSGAYRCRRLLKPLKMSADRLLSWLLFKFLPTCKKEGNIQSNAYRNSRLVNPLKTPAERLLSRLSPTTLRRVSKPTTAYTYSSCRLLKPWNMPIGRLLSWL